MLKIRVFITKSTGEKYPAVLIYSNHDVYHVTTVFGEGAIPLKTITNQSFEEHVSEIEDLLASLGESSDYKIMPVDNEMSDLINKFRNSLFDDNSTKS